MGPIRNSIAEHAQAAEQGMPVGLLSKHALLSYPTMVSLFPGGLALLHNALTSASSSQSKSDTPITVPTRSSVNESTITVSPNYSSPLRGDNRESTSSSSRRKEYGAAELSPIDHNSPYDSSRHYLTFDQTIDYHTETLLVTNNNHPSPAGHVIDPDETRDDYDFEVGVAAIDDLADHMNISVNLAEPIPAGHTTHPTRSTASVTTDTSTKAGAAGLLDTSTVSMECDNSESDLRTRTGNVSYRIDSLPFATGTAASRHTTTHTATATTKANTLVVRTRDNSSRDQNSRFQSHAALWQWLSDPQGHHRCRRSIVQQSPSTRQSVLDTLIQYVGDNSYSAARRRSSYRSLQALISSSDHHPTAGMGTKSGSSSDSDSNEFNPNPYPVPPNQRRLGKTRRHVHDIEEFLQHVNHVKTQAKLSAGSVLIVCAKAQVESWATIVRSRIDLKLLVYTDSLAKRRKQFAASSFGRYDIVITTFDVLRSKEIVVPRTAAVSGALDMSIEGVVAFGSDEDDYNAVEEERRKQRVSSIGSKPSLSIATTSSASWLSHRSADGPRIERCNLHLVYWHWVLVDHYGMPAIGRASARGEALTALRSFHRIAVVPSAESAAPSSAAAASSAATGVPLGWGTSGGGGDDSVDDYDTTDSSEAERTRFKTQKPAAVNAASAAGNKCNSQLNTKPTNLWKMIASVASVMKLPRGITVQAISVDAM